MDLRPYIKSQDQIKIGCDVLNYQPFILSDDIQTGVAHSWIYGSEGGRNSNSPDFVLDRKTVSAEQWQKFSEANAQLRTMYDDWIDEIVKKFSGGSLLDVACNNGYFISRAMQKGMKKATGYDRENYSGSVKFLNSLTGSDAKFVHKKYDSWTHSIDGCKPHDVAVASLIMCHISDPLYFLSFLGKVANEAIFLFTGMGDTDAFQVYYSEPNRFYKTADFPNCFDNDVGLSRGLLYRSLELMGYKNIQVINYRNNWLPKTWYDTGFQQAILATR